jgi:hypothetical protein
MGGEAAFIYDHSAQRAGSQSSLHNKLFLSIRVHSRDPRVDPCWGLATRLIGSYFSI